MKLLTLLLALSHSCFATAGEPQLTPTALPGYRQSSLDVETGLLVQVGHFTDIDYRLVPTQLAWRSPRWFGLDMDTGGSWVVRHRAALLGTWVAEGPEHAYLGCMFSPSVEYWNASQTLSFYMGAGGGLGWIDSQAVPGGQGQDFTLNWFAHAGIELRLREGLGLRAGTLFQHMSNGGATEPNPGIDALGLTLGLTWRL